MNYLINKSINQQIDDRIAISIPSTYNPIPQFSTRAEPREQHIIIGPFLVAPPPPYLPLS